MEIFLLKINIPEFVHNGLCLLRKSGFEGYVIGGCVRDSLLGRLPKDWDIATNATPDEIVALFQAQISQSNRAFGTFTIGTFPQSFEITTYRAESDYTDYRRPDSVVFVQDIHTDLLRRDFTINALAYNPFSQTLLDDFGGIAHLHARKIVCVGDARARFAQDSLRIMRAMRFCATLGFALDTPTHQALLQSLPLLTKLSSERKRDELNRCLLGAVPMGLCAFVPVLQAILGAEWHEPNWNLFASLPYELHLHLAALLLQSKSPETILQNLKYSKNLCKLVVKIITHYPLQADIAALQKALVRLGDKSVCAIVTLCQAQGDTRIASALQAALQGCHSLAMLKINGADLCALGVPPKQIGTLLHALLSDVIDGKIANTKAELVRAAHSRG